MIPALTNHLWQSTLFAAGVALLAALLKNHRAQTRYWLWLAASVKFAVPFGLLVAIGSSLSPLHPAPPRTMVRVQAAIEQVSQPFSGIRAASAPLPRRLGVPLTPLLAALWGARVLCIGWNWGTRARRLRASFRAAQAVPLMAPIPVLASPLLRQKGFEPGVYGIRRPVLLVPEGIVDQLSPQQMDAIIAHECCHARRRDNLAGAFQMTLQAVLWFYPPVWWVGKRLIEERERACDEEVLRSGSDPEVYAEGILKVCKFYVESPLLCVAGVTGANLKRRIAEIMSAPVRRELHVAHKMLLGAAGLTALTLPVSVGLLHVAPALAQTNNSQYTFGMQTSAGKSFEVATVKPGPPDDTGWNLHPPEHGGIVMENMDLHKIVASSFRVQDSMVVGPDWMDSTRYTIVGKGADPTAQNPVVWEMTRALLRDRFQLKYHIEPRERPVYALVVAKRGPELKNPLDGPCAPAIARGEHCANLRFGPWNLGITNMPVGAIIGGLGRIMQDRPIIDRTGLMGFYDMDVNWLPDGFKEPTAGLALSGAAAHLDVGAMMTALQEQAGLKLEAQRAPVDHLVIDRIERPGEN